MKSMLKNLFGNTEKCSYLSLSDGADLAYYSSVEHRRIDNQVCFYNFNKK